MSTGTAGSERRLFPWRGAGSCWRGTQAELSYEPRLGVNSLSPTMQNCKVAILDWFRTMEGLPKVVAEQSRSFFFFSGHGLEIYCDHQVLLPSDYLEPNYGTPNAAISTLNLAQGLKTLKVRNHFFLLDACRNDDDGLRQTQNLTGEQILNVVPPYMHTRPPCYTPIFYASASGGQAWEPTHPTKGLSVFGQAILDGLKAEGGLVPDCSGTACVVPVHRLDGFLKHRFSRSPCRWEGASMPCSAAVRSTRTPH